MEPVTINLEGLAEFGPYGYLLVYVLVTAALGAFARRHARLAGETTGDAQSSHIATGIVTTVLGLLLFIVTLSGADAMFDSSIATAQRNLKAQEAVAISTVASKARPPLNTYVVWASDEKAYAINTLERLSEHQKHRLQFLASEISCLGVDVGCVNGFAERCLGADIMISRVEDQDGLVWALKLGQSRECLLVAQIADGP